jgi:hypothetical protein
MNVTLNSTLELAIARLKAASNNKIAIKIAILKPHDGLPIRSSSSTEEPNA